MYSLLYVDDEQSLLEIGRLFLEETGDFSVTTIDSAPAGLDLLQQEQFDAIISDYQMPGMDGIKFLIEVRKKFGLLPFILFTGKGREEIVIQALNNGADFYLQKGGHPEAQYTELSNKIRYAISRRHTEEALRENQRILQQAQEVSRVGHFVSDIKTGTWISSPVLDEIFGIDDSFVRNIENWSSIICPEYRQKLVDYYYRVIVEKSRFDMDYKVIRPCDGQVRWVWALGEFDYDSAGNPVRQIGTIQDITERKNAEEALTKRDLQIRNLFENIPIGMFESTAEGKFVFVNSAISTMLGYDSPEDLIQTVNKTSIADALYEHPETRPAFVREVLQDSGSWKTFENRYRKKDGTIIDALLSFSEHIDPVTGLKNLYGFVQDITERTKAVKMLSESEEKFRSLAESSPDYIMRYDRQCRHIYMNPAALRVAGITEDQIIGKTHRESGFDEAQSRFWEEKITGVLETGKPYQTQFSWESVDGSVFLDWMLTPEFSEDGTVRSVLGVSRDITRLKKTQEELLRKNEELNASYEELAASAEELRLNIHELSRQEQALMESKQELTDIIEFLPDATFVIDREGTVIAWNRAIEEMTGVSKEEIIGKGDHEYSIPFYGERQPSLLDLIDLENKELEARYQVVTRKGNTLYAEVFTPALYGGKGAYVWVTGSPLFDLSGKRIGAIESVRDITGWKQAEASLHESEQKYRNVIKYANEAIIVAQDGQLKLVNPRTVEMTGYSEQELLSRPFSDFIHPDDRAMVVLRYQQRLNGEHVPSRYTFRLNQKADCTKWVEISAVHINWEGHPATLNFLFDITERKLAEEALKESEEKYRTLVEKANEAIIIAQHDVFVFANHRMSELLGVPIGDLIGKPFINYIWPEDRALVVANYRKRMSGENIPDAYDFRVLGAGGKQIWVSLSAAMIHWKGKPATLNLLTDITVRKRAEEALLQVNRKLNILSGITRHDINNQITVLKGYLRILEKKQSDPTLIDYTRKTEAAADRISGMIQFTKEYEEIGVHAPVWQDCWLIVNKAIEESQLGTITAKNDLPSGIEVFSDPLIKKVFYNLMDNAARYGPQITTIRFSIEERDGDQIIVCEDDGNGVPAEAKGKVFERGFGKNTGMGLFLSREILSITGITIIETGEAGKGARFEMTVPAGMWRQA